MCIANDGEYLDKGNKSLNYLIFVYHYIDNITTKFCKVPCISKDVYRYISTKY